MLRTHLRETTPGLSRHGGGSFFRNRLGKYDAPDDPPPRTTPCHHLPRI